jgi:hypothetical protein
LRRERRGGDDVDEDEEVVRTPPIVSSSLVSIVVYSLEENRLLGVDGAIIVVFQLPAKKWLFGNKGFFGSSSSDSPTLLTMMSSPNIKVIYKVDL